MDDLIIIAYLLYEVKEEQHFHFGLVQQAAFNKLKDALSKEPVLKFTMSAADYMKPYMVSSGAEENAGMAECGNCISR
ncbi:hypothetical protein ALC60_11209 [Trachymyrmex zeteki]|uniref:Uncharacterized protein n=1 Tax=Mycetomoellerius zeteki TaxID=64791 RepID=A0A151WPI9_9HYME|nr:hypothetical protein ALC60_11209 [Trachymyrmex zeteki]